MTMMAVMTVAAAMMAAMMAAARLMMARQLMMAARPMMALARMPELKSRVGAMRAGAMPVAVTPAGQPAQMVEVMRDPILAPNRATAKATPAPRLTPARHLMLVRVVRNPRRQLRPRWAVTRASRQVAAVPQPAVSAIFRRRWVGKAARSRKRWIMPLRGYPATGC
jgi:hypothetical protein